MPNGNLFDQATDGMTVGNFIKMIIQKQLEILKEELSDDVLRHYIELRLHSFEFDVEGGFSIEDLIENRKKLEKETGTLKEPACYNLTTKIIERYYTTYKEIHDLLIRTEYLPKHTNFSEPCDKDYLFFFISLTEHLRQRTEESNSPCELNEESNSPCELNWDHTIYKGLLENKNIDSDEPVEQYTKRLLIKIIGEIMHLHETEKDNISEACKCNDDKSQQDRLMTSWSTSLYNNSSPENLNLRKFQNIIRNLDLMFGDSKEQGAQGLTAANLDTDHVSHLYTILKDYAVLLKSCVFGPFECRRFSAEEPIKPAWDNMGLPITPLNTKGLAAYLCFFKNFWDTLKIDQKYRQESQLWTKQFDPASAVSWRHNRPPAATQPLTGATNTAAMNDSQGSTETIALAQHSMVTSVIAMGSSLLSLFNSQSNSTTEQETKENNIKSIFEAV